MARIPTVTSSVRASSGRTSAGVPSARVTADAFGAAGGRALERLGSGVSDLGHVIMIAEEKQSEEDAANAVAQSDFTRTELEMRNQIGPDAAGYQEQTLEAYDAWVDEQAESIEDDATRAKYKTRMAAQRPNVSSRSATYELSTAAQYSKDQADASLTSLDNKIRLVPGDYDSHIQQGFDVIDARDGLPATIKEQMKTKWREGAALSRFEGMLESATTKDEVTALQEELRDTETRDWTQELSSAGLERITSLADAASRSIQTKADADARGAVGSLETRASDVSAMIPRAELAAAQAVVNASENPVTAARMARIVRDQQIVAETRRLPPAQQRDILDTKYANPSLPPRLNTAITKAAQMFGVSPAYLASTAEREYGMFLNGNPDDIDYGKGNAEGASSAEGVMQFIKGTWLGVVKDPRFLAAVGLDITGKTEAELLALRGDPELAMMGGAFFTANNARLAKAALGREPTDADLYIMHFMGEGGGPRLFRLMQSNPDMSAAHLFPEQAKANHSVYHNKDGSERTVREVYAELGRLHGTGDGSETYVEYGDRKTREKVLKDTETRLADDPMGFSVSAGTASISDIFDRNGMAQRGEQARSVAGYYSIPEADMKPFTKSEAERIGETFKNGSADEVLGILTSVQQMGGDVARAAMAQLGDVDDVYAHAGGLQLETGQGGVAADIVKGQKRLDENPDIASQIGAAPSDLSDAFVKYTGGALMEVSPRQRQAVMDAALAHYVETQVSKGRHGKFDETSYGVSVQAVLGGRKNASAIETVNGTKTVLPPGVSGPAMERALENMTVADWSVMSESGEPPRYVTGEIADPQDLADEAQLRAIGGGKYRVLTSDGAYLVTGHPAPNGQLEPYIFVPTAEAVSEVNAIVDERRDVGRGLVFGEQSSQEEDLAAARADGTLTTEEQQALFSKYGALWAFDADGNRIEPTQ